MEAVGGSPGPAPARAESRRDPLCPLVSPPSHRHTESGRGGAVARPRPRPTVLRLHAQPGRPVVHQPPTTRDPQRRRPLAQLRERRLVPWALAYLAGAWLLLQVVAILVMNLGWPNRVVVVAAGLLGAGLLAVLVLAWRRGAQSWQRVSGPELLIVTGGLVLVGAAVAWLGPSPGVPTTPTVGIAFHPAARGAEPAARSVAVLAFEEPGVEAGQGYLGEALAAELRARLAQVGTLQVVPYAPTGAGGARPAAHVLSGQVQRAGDHVRLRAQLTDARTAAVLWEALYERELPGLLDVQADLARRVAGSLDAEVPTAAQRGPLSAAPPDAAAYELYLRARGAQQRDAAAAPDAALELLRRATSLDPGFALAWAALAEAYAARAARSAEVLQWADSAVAAAGRALALDAELPEAHHALGRAHGARGAVAHAITSLERAVALSPSAWTTMQELAALNAGRGRYDEALRWLRRAEPGAGHGRAALLARMGFVRAQLGDFDTAAVLLNQALALQPGSPLARGTVVWLALLQERHAEAAAHARQLAAAPPDAPALLVAGSAFLLAGDTARAGESFRRAYELAPSAVGWYGAAAVSHGHLLRLRGEHAAADRVLERFEAFAERALAGGSESGALRHAVAALHAVRGERAEALRWLGLAQQAGWNDHFYARQDPTLRALHGDAAFERIVAANGAALERQRARVAREGW